jgi:L-malate glycosyltransferase
MIAPAAGAVAAAEVKPSVGSAAAAAAAAPPPWLKDFRLLVVSDSSSTHTHRWTHWFRDRGAKVSVLSTFPDKIDGVNVIHFPGKKWYRSIPKLRMLLDYLPFRQIIRDIDPQLIHFHFVSEGGRAYFWEKIDVPMVASSWGQDVIFDTGPQPKAEVSLRRIFARCRFVTATTHQLARETARYVSPGRSIYVIPFGVDLHQFPLKSASDGRGAAGQNKPVTLGFVKHLLPKYGPDVMVEAFAEIHRLRPNTKLVLAGRGWMQPQLERRVAELGLAGAVEILGRVPHDQVPALTRSFDLMVMPSVYESETFGVAAIEASASGVPVVASRVGGVPEAVIDGQTGILVPPRDVKALVETCIALIDDPKRRRTMGLAGRRFVERYYQWQQNCLAMEEVYRAVIESDAPRGVPVFREGVQPDLSVPPEG